MACESYFKVDLSSNLFKFGPPRLDGGGMGKDPSGDMGKLQFGVVEIQYFHWILWFCRIVPVCPQ